MSEKFDTYVLNLAKQKVFYIYGYMSSFERFKEEFPRKDKFYSSLTIKKNSNNEYEYVLKILNRFSIKTLNDYHDLYLKCDVLQLADTFERPRTNSLKNYVHVIIWSHQIYAQMQCLIWQRLSLNLFQMLASICSSKKVWEAEFPYIYKRYSKAKNKYLESSDQESKYVIYLDKNILYGYAIFKFLQTSGFKWIGPKDFDSNKYSSSSSKFGVLELDLKCLKELRELYNDYPLA